ncbi:MAG: DUF3147 family protein [Sulfobacillus sp.]|nr:DUF3147 family protein [Sulfobacillus sp.]
MNWMMVIRFGLGGLVVAVVSLLARLAPAVSGILAGFPAIFFTSLVIIGISHGKSAAIHFSSTAVWGMLGSILSVLSVWAGLKAGLGWPWLIVLGILTYGGFVWFLTRVKAHPTPQE